MSRQSLADRVERLERRLDAIDEGLSRLVESVNHRNTLIEHRLTRLESIQAVMVYLLGLLVAAAGVGVSIWNAVTR